jgi:hypothetical protein
MGEQQKTQRVLDSGRRGEAPEAVDRGAEPMAANPETESPSACDRLMEEVCVDSVKQDVRFTDNHLGRSAEGIVAG